MGLNHAGFFGFASPGLRVQWSSEVDGRRAEGLRVQVSRVKRDYPWASQA